MTSVSVEPQLEGTPVHDLFAQAQLLFNGAVDQEGDSAASSMSKCLGLLDECSRRVRQLALFSPNEELDDVSTTNLKYLLIPYMQADVTHRMPVLQRTDLQSRQESNSNRLPYTAPSPEDLAELRLRTLRSVLQFLDEFLSAADRLQLVSKEERLSLLGSLDSSASLDPSTQRAVKVARFKREKELRQRLEMLKARRAAARRISIRRNTETRGLARENGQGDDLGDEETDDSADSFLDEAEERKLWVTELQSAWVKSIDLEQTVKKEKDMLASAKQASEGRGLRSVAQQPLTREQLDRNLQEREASHRRAAAAAERELRSGIAVNPTTITCAALAQDVIEGRAGPDEISNHKHVPMPFAFGPVSLMNQANAAVNGNIGSLSALGARQLAAARVFQPGHSLPTMSIEEAGLREMKMMTDFQDMVQKEMEDQGLQVKEKGSAVGLGDGGQPDEESEDEDEKETDAAVMKARAWDDWKDENPRGKGNSKLTPCG